MLVNGPPQELSRSEGHPTCYIVSVDTTRAKKEQENVLGGQKTILYLHGTVGKRNQATAGI